VQVGLAYILNQCLSKLKSIPEAYPFLKPVNKKTIKDYYNIIRKPMDLETMEKKNQGNPTAKLYVLI
jgi:transcription initiation factor TFIID subunit 1